MFSKVTNARGLVLTVGILLVNGISAHAYPATGTVNGFITDAVTKEPIVGATVIIKNQGIGAKTDGAGVYTINNIPAGMHSLKISNFGYFPTTINIVAVIPNQTILISRVLNRNPADTPQVVTITGEIKIKAPPPATTAECLLVQIGEVIVRSENQVLAESIEEHMIKHKPAMTVDELLTQVSDVVQNLNGQVFIRGGTTYEAAYILTGTSAGIPFPLGGFGEQVEAGKAIEATQINIDPTDTIMESRKLRTNGTYRRNPMRIRTAPDIVDTAK